MNAQSENEITALKNIIVINNDRYEGYKKAGTETVDKDLQPLFLKYAEQSKMYAQALKNLIPHDEKPVTDETTAAGKIYRIWMDAKIALSSNDRKAILSSCEFGEDAALSTYDKELKDSAEINDDTLKLISMQRAELKAAHDHVKSLRDNA